MLQEGPVLSAVICASRQLRRSLKSEEDEGAWEIDKQNRFLPFICVSICQIQLKEENDMKKKQNRWTQTGIRRRLLNWVLGETFRLQNPGFRGCLLQDVETPEY